MLILITFYRIAFSDSYTDSPPQITFSMYVYPLIPLPNDYHPLSDSVTTQPNFNNVFNQMISLSHPFNLRNIRSNDFLQCNSTCNYST